jgi:hypothetical protein
MRAGTGDTELAPLWRTTGKPSRFSSDGRNVDRHEAAITGFLCACAEKFCQGDQSSLHRRVRGLMGEMGAGFEGFLR